MYPLPIIVNYQLTVNCVSSISPTATPPHVIDTKFQILFVNIFVFISKDKESFKNIAIVHYHPSKIMIIS